MPCNCNTTAELPQIADIPTSPQARVEVCCEDPSLAPADPGTGTELNTSWTDAACYKDEVILLGRVGTKLVRFAGSGFIKLVNGVASVVTSVPLSVRTLWHRWWKASASANPVLGAPLAYPYQVIADASGNIHGIRGEADKDALPLWNGTTEEFTMTPVAEIPQQKKGPFVQASGIELVGYAPLSTRCSETVRPIKGLSGAGLVVLSEVDTSDDECGCTGANETVSVATALALPPSDDSLYRLTCLNGELAWVIEE
jgi:hypothetical protein